ncbi:Transcriptional regulator [Seminavis robusta]|uniref:Transcriptional regulator n=1 Tax=Seminavis robusta TaxID=568900 RepID=A0A9N8DYS8_9STRA|nr:Transcriptional regulator [Seminavis robusta]|eukprot:Sro376_g129640.1 Transcriptional regulator (136) ;mRNA; r:17220-17749
MRSIFASLFVALCLLARTSAFVTPSSSTTALSRNTVGTAAATTSTQLHERQWNFNEGQGPFGMKKNAEIWNGRVAQMAFLVIFIQELVQGKGVIQGFQEGDPANVAGFAGFFLTIAGLTGFLALKGKNDYVDENL